MGMKTKGVAFNLDDPDQAELYEWAMSRTNFSAYMKRLIQADMATKKTTGQKPAVAKQPGAPLIKSGNGEGIKIKIG